jgi:hypothetical protein
LGGEMRHTWTISLENLKERKMYEEEAVELLKVLKEQKAPLEEREASERFNLYHYSHRWGKTFKELHDINQKIQALELKMKEEECDDE